LAPRDVPVTRVDPDAARNAASGDRGAASAAADGELVGLNERGLSLRQIARMFGLSHETVRQRVRR
jgi:DNA-binding NarL/FixJ family response regulator